MLVKKLKLIFIIGLFGLGLAACGDSVQQSGRLAQDPREVWQQSFQRFDRRLQDVEAVPVGVTRAGVRLVRRIG